MSVDVKTAVILLCLTLSGYLFYVNQKRENVIVALTEKYQTALTKSQTAAVVSDVALMEEIRQRVAEEIKARPAPAPAPAAADGKCQPVNLSRAQIDRLQDLQNRVEAFDKRFAAMTPGLKEKGAVATESERIEEKASRVMEKVIALCKKK